MDLPRVELGSKRVILILYMFSCFGVSSIDKKQQNNNRLILYNFQTRPTGGDLALHSMN